MKDTQTSEQANNYNRNPEGKGGFADNPQNINKGGKPKNVQRFDYWMTIFKNMTMGELKQYIKDKDKDDMYVAESIAYSRVLNSKEELQEFREVADRTEGKAPQTVVHEGSAFNDRIAKVVDFDAEIESEQETEEGATAT